MKSKKKKKKSFVTKKKQKKVTPEVVIEDEGLAPETPGVGELYVYLTYLNDSTIEKISYGC